MIKAVIFDYDGTLSNRQKSAYSFYRDFISTYNLDLSEVEFEAMLQDLIVDDCNGTIPFDCRMKPFMLKYGKLFSNDFEEKITKAFFDKMWSYNVLKDETIETLEKLQGKYKLAILSNGDSIIQHNKIRHVNIEKYFDEIVVTGDIGVHKPDVRPFEYTLNKLGVENDEALMVGDVFATDILGASRANIKTVWLLEDSERPNFSYKGYRIRKLNEIFDVLKKEIR